MQAEFKNSAPQTESHNTGGFGQMLFVTAHEPAATYVHTSPIHVILSPSPYRESDLALGSGCLCHPTHALIAATPVVRVGAGTPGHVHSKFFADTLIIFRVPVKLLPDTVAQSYGVGRKPN